jgi:P-type conjugative transfer protein TrbJ
MIRRLCLVGVAALAIGVGSVAQAQVTVFDPANYAQSVLTAARSLTQITNQITMLQNQAQMLVNGAKNLSNLNFSSLAALTSDLAQIQRLLSQAQGLSFSVGLTNSQFSQIYPTTYGSGFSSGLLVQNAQSQWSASQAALMTTVQAQSQIANSITADQTTLAQINAKSGSAVGQLAAVQATNQLLALLIKEIMQGQALQIAQDRATASEATRGLSATLGAQATRSQFSGSSQAYAPAPVTVFAQ